MSMEKLTEIPFDLYVDLFNCYRRNNNYSTLVIQRTGKEGRNIASFCH